jgi:hypothetical protein
VPGSLRWVFDGVDYQLRWPRQMFLREAKALKRLPEPRGSAWWARAEQLLTQAFAGTRPVDDLRAARPHVPAGTGLLPVSTPAGGSSCGI